jgi:hypothetical protein
MLRSFRPPSGGCSGGPEDRGSRYRRLNKALSDKLWIDWSNQTIASFSIGQHWRSPPVPANNFLRQNPLSAKRMIIKLGFWLCDCPEKGAASKK